MTSINNGIQVFNEAQFTATVVAVGDHARAVNRLEERGEQEVAARLSDLVAALERHAHELAEPERAVAATRELVAELPSPQRDRTRVTALLQQLAGTAGSVASVLTPINSLVTAVSKVL